MKIKTLLRVHLFPVRMAIMKKIGKDGGRGNLYTMLVGMQINVVTMKIGILFLKNINNSTSIWSSIPPLVIHLKKSKSASRKITTYPYFCGTINIKIQNHLRQIRSIAKKIYL